MKNQIIVNIIFCLSFIQVSYTQSNLEGDEMDFWLGSWNLEWERADGQKGKGVNVVEKILDGAVILENFKGLKGSYEGFEGKSFSVFDKRFKVWKQTWVDSNSSYLEFDFEIIGEKRIFKRTVELPNGKKFITRMVFHSIEKDRFIWEWQRSDDGGDTWKTNWKINYFRDIWK